MFAPGVVAGWVALVLGRVAYWDMTDASGCERAGIFAVMFGIGPLVRLGTGTVTALLVRQRAQRSDTARAEPGPPSGITSMRRNPASRHQSA